MQFFKKQKKQVVVRKIPTGDGPRREFSAEKPQTDTQPAIPSGLFVKCASCQKAILNEELLLTQMVCPFCGYHFRLTASQRILLTADEGSFIEHDATLRGQDPLSFPGYEEKVRSLRAMTGLQDAVICGQAKIDGRDCILCAMDSNFLMGSMGAAVGEKLARAAETAFEKRLPLLVFTVSGGARMQEGIVSLMQMAKVSGAIGKLNESGLLYVCILTDPTTGGVTASFAMLGDIILAEPRALIGFAGRRVIEQTIGQTLPPDFQSAEFLLKKGFIDAIVPRENMRMTLSTILKLHSGEGEI